MERKMSVTVSPKIVVAERNSGQWGNGNVPKMSPPVTVDLSLVREKDGSKRVVASSPDGAIVSGLDIPIETLTLGSRECGQQASASTSTSGWRCG